MKIIKKAFLLSIVLLIICGIGYPLLMTGLSQLVFPRQAKGSIIEIGGKKVGSEVLGQSFSDARFFKGRPSAVNYNTYTEADTKPDNEGKTAYSGVSSGSQNLAPSNPALAERVQKDMDAFLKANPDIRKDQLPADLLTASGSGLDPHISPKAAQLQIPAIAKATGIGEVQLNKIIDKYTDGKQLGIFGEPRVNVLKANLEIYKILNMR
ncbi:K(+)-transporting ATPase subunit C [Clostridium sp. A1-XYC3]|uniref:Potassium-transporting ATPase KdpC subunit n=1 Tax=Clostridium tanneri TaxID=3037988 RepID=A0ABU4JVE8_9CLOT|nr:K(+)-transporting ATPase subunit C [Clostridium sp. A1-XYC3]MDW8802129.1 K(+)-transporting ATPase subunit C [Clostridium sp. A1-XYC3]